jgi:hypothetical protein
MGPEIMSLDGYLHIYHVHQLTPDTTQPDPFGYTDRGRGGTTFLNTGCSMAFMALIEFRPETGPRGRHRHFKKQEYLYVITGSLKGRYWLVHEDQAEEYIHPVGTLIRVEPGLFHVFECIDSPALALEFSPQPFDSTDYDYPES